MHYSLLSLRLLPAIQSFRGEGHEEATYVDRDEWKGMRGNAFIEQLYCIRNGKDRQLLSTQLNLLFLPLVPMLLLCPGQ